MMNDPEQLVGNDEEITRWRVFEVVSDHEPFFVGHVWGRNEEQALGQAEVKFPLADTLEVTRDDKDDGR